MAKPPLSTPSSSPPAPLDPTSRIHRFIGPGDQFASTSPMALTTVVGSGVAIGLFHPETRAGGLCHYALPICPKKTSSSGRFGDSALRVLLEHLLKLGCSIDGMQAKIFGGANISPRPSLGRSLGDENITIAHYILESAGIPIVEQHTGGNKGRQVAYNTDDGSSTIRTL